MRKIFKLIFIIILPFLFFIVGFYFWASSPNLSTIKYSNTYTNNYPSKIINDSIFSIITYNIGYLSGMTNNLAVEKPKKLFDKNLKLVLQELRKINTDFIALQEIDFDSKRSFYINQQNEIAKLGYNYVGQTINWDKKYVPFPYYPVSLQFGKILSGQSILSKYKIIDQERIILSRNPKNIFYYDAFYLDRLAQIVKIQIKGKILILINVHLEAFDKETRFNQTKKIIQIFKRYSLKYPTILLGDFNSDIHFDQASIRLLLKVPNTGNTAFNKDHLQNTFNSKKPTERLDYIFYNTNFITFLSGHVLTEFNQSSDHLPLIMNFKIK